MNTIGVSQCTDLKTQRAARCLTDIFSLIYHDKDRWIEVWEEKMDSAKVLNLIAKNQSFEETPFLGEVNKADKIL